MSAPGSTVIEDLPVLIDFQYLITEALSPVSHSCISFVILPFKSAYKTHPMYLLRFGFCKCLVFTTRMSQPAVD